MKPRVCKECQALDVPPARPRKAHYPGPRCREHHLARQHAVRTKQHQAYVAKTYGLPDGFYEALYEAQGGRCAWCARAMGKAKRLAVDHDHACCPGSTSCGKCARGLLCSACNMFLGFQMADDPDRIQRGKDYLARPPAQELWISWNGP